MNPPRPSGGGLWRHAPIGVAAFSTVFPLVQAAIAFQPFSVVFTGAPADNRAGIWALSATLVLLVPYVHLVYYAAQGVTAPGGGWTLIAIGAILLAGVPLVGTMWLATFHVGVVAALLVLRPPWSVAAAAVALAVPAVLGYLLDPVAHMVRWYPVAVLWRASAVFALVWLVGAVRRLHEARTALAERAVARERVRIDDEVGRTVGVELDEILARARRAAAAADSDPDQSDLALRQLVAGARRTLAEARRLISGYHGSSVRTELNTAVSLLSAAGISARLVLPARLPERPDPEFRSQLRSAVTRLLADPRDCVIEVTGAGTGLRVELHPDEEGAAA